MVLAKGDIIQITNREHHWFPVLLIVDDVKHFGCAAKMIHPLTNDGKIICTYIRLEEEDYTKVGVTVVSDF